MHVGAASDQGMAFYQSAGVKCRGNRSQILGVFALCGVHQNRIGKIDNIFTQMGGIGRIFQCPPAQLERLGLTSEEIDIVGVVRSTVESVLYRPVSDRPVLNTLSKVIDYLHMDMAYQAKEVFRVLFLNNKLHLLHNELMGIGSISSVEIHPRTIMARALEVNAQHLLLVHNHPSGDPSPSREDVLITARVQDAGKLFGINVLDHIIIALTGHASLQSLNMMQA